MTPNLTFPKTDTGLLQWSQNLVNLITPVPATYNLVTADVTAYTLLHNGYAAALALCDPSVRSKSAVVSKNQARTSLKTGAALVANKVYSSSTVTDAQKTALGMPPRQSPQPTPAPSTKPVIEVISMSGLTATIRLRDADGANRGRPPGTAGAAVLSYTGAAPAPTDVTKWAFEGVVGKVNKINVAFPSDLANGSQVYLTAFWFSGRKQNGPASDPISLIVQGGGVTMAA